MAVNKSVVQVPKYCCSEKCRRVSQKAQKVSDFWLSTCDEHANGPLSINRAIEQLMPKEVKRGT